MPGGSTTTDTPTTEPVRLPLELFSEVDRSSPVPLYFQLASRIEQAIVVGQLPPGARLENETSLGERLNVSRPTVRRALQELVDRGLLVRRRGVGTQVVRRPVHRRVELTSLYDDLAQAGRQPSTVVLAHELLSADQALAERLGVAEGTPVLHIRRLRLTGGVPLAVMENFLGAELADLSAEQIRSHGLYQLMRARGVQIRVAAQHIGARLATAQEARLLEIRRHGPVLTMERTAYASSGRAVEFGHHCYRPDLYSFELTLVQS